MPMVCSKHLGSFLGFTFSDLHGFLSQQYFDPNEVLVLGSNGVNACKKSELKNIYGGIKEARKGAGLAVIEMFQVQIDAWPEGREKAKMSGWLKDAKDCPGYIKAADFVDELKKLAKPESTDTTRRDGVLINFDAAKAALKKAADDFEASTALLDPASRSPFFQGACDATSTLIDALQVQADAIDRLLPTQTASAPEVCSEHTQRMREELATQINALRGHLNTALASVAPDQSISFQEVWTCLEAGHQKLAKLEGYTATVVPTNTKALPAGLSGATKFQRDLQKQMMGLLAKHQSDGSNVDISPEVVQALRKDIDQLKNAVTGQGRTVDEQAKTLLAVADQILGRLSPTASLPTYANLFAWSQSIATMPGFTGAAMPAQPTAIKPTADQIAQRDRLLGLMREVVIVSHGDDEQGDETQASVKVQGEAVQALKSELKRARLRFADTPPPPRLRACVDEMRKRLKAAKQSQPAELAATDIKDLYVMLRELEEFPAVKRGGAYHRELQDLIRIQIDELKRLERNRRMSQPPSGISASVDEENQVANCLRALSDGWSKAAAANHVKYEGLDKGMEGVVVDLSNMLSRNSVGGSYCTINDAIKRLETALNLD